MQSGSADTQELAGLMVLGPCVLLLLRWGALGELPRVLSVSLPIRRGQKKCQPYPRLGVSQPQLPEAPSLGLPASLVASWASRLSVCGRGLRPGAPETFASGNERAAQAGEERVIMLPPRWQGASSLPKGALRGRVGAERAWAWLLWEEPGAPVWKQALPPWLAGCRSSLLLTAPLPARGAPTRPDPEGSGGLGAASLHWGHSGWNTPGPQPPSGVQPQSRPRSAGFAFLQTPSLCLRGVPGASGVHRCQ